MPAERESQPISLTAIRINFKDRSITFEAEDRPVAKLSLAPEGVIFEVSSAPAISTHDAAASPTDASAKPTQEPSSVKPAEGKERTVTFSGKIKSQPKEGKPDSRGNPTAYARFAVHEEGREDAHLYLATFHRHTAKIALSLAKEAPITVEGYPHPSSDPKRMDTLSVINILNYPGKPEKEKP